MSTSSFFVSYYPKSIEPRSTIFDCLKKGVTQILSHASGRVFLRGKLAPLINSALDKNSETQKKLHDLRTKLFDPKSQYKAEKVQMYAPDETYIEGALFPADSKKAILFAMGSGGFYESIANPADAAHHFVKFFRTSFGEDINVLVINPRGVGASDGTASIQDSALDYYTAWNFLEARGIKTVIPWGHSLGFRYIVQSAAWKQEETSAKISIVSDRSFDDIGREAGELMGAGVKGAVVNGILQYAGWGGKAQDCWNKLNGKKLIIVAPEDNMVPYGASFYKTIQQHLPSSDGTSSVIKLRGAEDAPHTRIYSSEESTAIIREVRTLLGMPTEKLTKGIEAKAITYKPRKQSGCSNKTALLFLGMLAVCAIARVYYNTRT